MSEVENDTAKMVYRNEDIDYDVSKLNPEAQQAFMMLAQLQQGALRQAEIEMATLRAAQAQYNSIIKSNLDEEARINSDEPVIVENNED
tara:strand:+ start:414 stop:680 length:267 start_codon:yes stop_codon:yes gene_type:complete